MWIMFAWKWLRCKILSYELWYEIINDQQWRDLFYCEELCFIEMLFQYCKIKILSFVLHKKFPGSSFLFQFRIKVFCLFCFVVFLNVSISSRMETMASDQLLSYQKGKHLYEDFMKVQIRLMSSSGYLFRLPGEFPVLTAFSGKSRWGEQADFLLMTFQQSIKSHATSCVHHHVADYSNRMLSIHSSSNAYNVHPSIFSLADA